MRILNGRIEYGLVAVLVLSCSCIPYAGLQYLRLVRGEQQEIVARQWVSAPAKIEEFDIVQKRGVGIFLKVRYGYSFSGMNYSSTRDNFYTDWKSSLERDFVIENRGKDAAVVVYVDPRNPENAVRVKAYYTQEKLHELRIWYKLLTIGGAVVATSCMAFFFGSRKRQIKNT